MHRQIAGKLTGRVTKWIVLAFWVVVLVRRRRLRQQAHRRPEQRGVVLAAGQRRVHQGARQARAVPGPERHPHGRRLRPRRRPDRRATSPAIKEPGRRAAAPCDGVVRQRCVGPDPVRGRRRSPRRSSPSTSARTAGTRCPTPPTSSATSPRSTASTVHIAGAGRPGRRLRRGVRRASTAPCCSPACGVVILILLLTYRSPVLWILPIFSRRRRPDHRAGA